MARQRRRIGLRTRVISSFALLSAVLSLTLSASTYSIMRANTLDRREEVAKNLAFSNARFVREELLNDLNGSDVATSTRYDNVLRRPPVDGVSVLVYRDTPYLSPSSSALLNFNPDTDIPGQLRYVVEEHEPAVQRATLDGVPVLFIGIPLRLATTAASPATTAATSDESPSTATTTAVEAAAVSDPSNWATYYEVSSLADVEATFDTMIVVLAIADGLAILAGALVGRWVSRRVLAPLSDVNSAVQALADMSFDKLPATRDPDLAPLVSTFNNTVAALQERIERDGRFTSDVSHELRSPLTTLTASVSVLERYNDDLPEPAQRAVSLLTEEFERFQQLVGDLLEISRFDAGAQQLDRSPLVVGEFVRQATTMICPAGTPVNIDADLEEAVVMADKRRLVQVLSNLAVNADKYAGGVTGVSALRARGGVEIAVEDRGPGVPLADRLRVFERFSRGITAGKRGNDQGTGLGLALVSEHVRLHGGNVRVDDRVDGEPGARFVVYLPATPVSIYDTEADFEAAGIGADCMKRGTRRVALLAAMIALGSLLGCGLPEDSAPRIISGPVPFDLLGPAQLDAPEPSPGKPTVEIDVYLATNVGDEKRLVRQTRRLEPPVNLDAILNNLMAGGTTQSERDEGLVNLVPGGEFRGLDRTASTAQASTPVTSDPDPCATTDPALGGDGITATLNVTPEFFDRFPTESDRRLAIGQIVLTATNYVPPNDPSSRVTRVRFEVNGRVQYVPTANVGLQNMVWATHYSKLLSDDVSLADAPDATNSDCPTATTAAGPG